MKTIRKDILIISLLFPVAIGQLSSLIAGNSAQIYNQINRPAFAPAAIVFPIIWTILYLLMGISSYLIYMSDSPDKDTALSVYIVQLFLNFLWPIIFFRFGNYLLALLCLILLIIAVVIMIKRFYQINRTAALLQIPYLIWCIFAALLNYSVYTLNR